MYQLTIDDLVTGLASLDIGGHAGTSIASSASLAGLVGARVGGISGIQPQHVRVMIVPQAHDQHHGLRKALGELRESALVVESVAVTECNLLVLAEFRRDGVARDAVDGRLRIRDGLAVLDIEALDLGELAVGALQELRHDGELLGCIDGHAGTVEVLDALAVGVEIATVWVAGAAVTVRRVRTATAVTFAAVLAHSGAWVRSVGG